MGNFRAWLFVVLFGLSGASAGAFNDSPLVDNDGDAELLFAAGYTPSWLEATLHSVAVTRNFQKFEELATSLSPFLESKFDYYIFVNTAETGSNDDFIRPQHLRIIEKRRRDARVFPRTASGAIDMGAIYSWRPLRYGDFQRALYGFDVDGALSDGERIVYKEMPVSTGIDNVEFQMIRTYSGIFRANHERSRRQYSPNFGSAMSWSIYVDHVYADGREAGLAVHGTPFEFEIFGSRRSSHGCVRTHPNFAQQNYPKVMSPELWDDSLPDWPRTAVVPTAAAQSGRGGTRPGARALIILFDGFSIRHI